ncbi:uncharacterized protein LOC113386922 [Ctenocephalides felis]|uniref:uncharacterized protein LOC113386922 n=1 Tax=Ctenocephalides felis TaxID=7515 RepID=UPI000E6E590E|nr:uncharacterized protein LOC113386922 [Ctenocephalides felis]
MADLKRQVVFLQTQLEDKERTVQLLQLQMTKYSQNRTNGLQGNQNQNQVLSNLPINGVSEDKAVNAATQTERLRPMSTGPTTYQQLGEANGLLSASDSSDGGSEKTRKRLTNASSLPRRLNRTSNNSAQQSSTLHTDMKHTSLCCRCRKEILDCTNNGSSADTRSDDSQRSRKRSGSRTRSQKTNGCTNKLESKDSSDCDGQLAKPRSKSTPRLRSSKKYPSDIYLLPCAKNSANVCDLPNGACVMMSSNGSQNVISNCNSLGSSSEFLNGGTASRIGRMKRTNV